jgi:hypothetical protein
VTTTDESSGDVVEWNRQVITLDDGSKATIFSAAFRPLPGRTYRMKIHRPGRAGTQARTRIPAAPGLTVTEPINQIQSVFLNDLLYAPDQISMKYEVVVPEDQAERSIEIIYANDKSVTKPSGRVDVRLLTDRFIVQSRLLRDEDDPPLTLKRLGLVVRLPSEDFEKSSGTRDDNIVNGEGFFGSVAQFELNWTLAEDVVLSLGYENGQ